jgi:hypothetical protein
VPAATSAGPGGGGAVGSTPPSAPNGPGGATPAPAPAAPTPSTCRDDGRQNAISLRAPPCKPLFEGDNGGATATGVYADHIDVAFYQYPPNAATQAALVAAGASDQPADIDRDIDVLRQYFNNFSETYAREIRYRKYVASGKDSSDDVAAVADAKTIVADKMFGVISGGTAFSPVFNEEIERNGLVCVFCVVSPSRSYQDRTKGFDFSTFPSLRDYYEQIADYWGKRLVGVDPETGQPRGAKYRGDCTPGLPADPCAQPRKFGLVWLKSTLGKVDPGAQEERDNFVANILPSYGITLCPQCDVSYDYDVTTAPQQAGSIIAKLHAANVSTIVLMTEPLTPVFFTKEATNEGYFPEWFISGFALTDTTFFGRTYDKAQWAHAFGISPLWVFPDDFTKTDGYREYQLMCPVSGHENETNSGNGQKACEPFQNGTQNGGQGSGINVYERPPGVFAMCVQMAGPHLTAQSFAAGCYAFPPTGGFPELPLNYYTPDDQTFVKDFSEVWWNSTGTGLDEVNKQGTGIVQKANGGHRTEFFHWPSANPYAFAADPNPVYSSANYPQANFTGTAPPPAKKCLSCT